MAGDTEYKESGDPVKAIRDSLGNAKTRLTEEDKSESKLMDDLMNEVSGSSSRNRTRRESSTRI